MKPLIVLELSEADVVKLILDFLQEKELYISQTGLEKESGISNYSHQCDDAIFLRQLISSGNWDDVIDFLQPLFDIGDFPRDLCTYLVLRGKYLEMLCLRSEIVTGTGKGFDEIPEVNQCIRALESVCPSKEEWKELKYLSSLKSLTDNPQYSRLTPHHIRMKCFKDIISIVEPFFPYITSRDNKPKRTTSTNRLKNLLIKGILYETCVELCTQRALANDSQSSHRIVADVSHRNVLNGPELSDADAGLVSWLESLPNNVYLLPFEQRSLELRFHSLDSQITPVKPSWAEYIISQNRIEKSRILGLAATSHLNIEAVEVENTIQNSREPSLRNPLPQNSLSQSLVNTYTTSKIQNAQQFPHETSPRENFGSGQSLQHVSSQSSKHDTVSPPPPPPSFMRQDESQNSGTPQSEIPQLKHIASSEQIVVSGSIEVTKDSYISVPSEKADKINSPDTSKLGSNAPKVSSALTKGSGSRTRSTSPPPRRPPTDEQNYIQKETKSSLLQFMPVTVLEDSQPVRAVAIHEQSGKFYAVGSNSRNLRICYYPDTSRNSAELDFAASSRDAYVHIFLYFTVCLYQFVI